MKPKDTANRFEVARLNSLATLTSEGGGGGGKKPGQKKKFNKKNIDL